MPTKKYKYHFLTVTETAYGRSVVVLPGQKAGCSEIHPGVAVRDARGTTALTRMKKKVPAGTVLFTTTLKNKTSYYEASDIYILDEVQDVTMSNVHDEYDKLYGTEGPAERNLQDK